MKKTGNTIVFSLFAALACCLAIFIGCNNSALGSASNPDCWYVNAEGGKDVEDRGTSPGNAFASLTWALDQARKTHIKVIILLGDTSVDAEDKARELLAKAPQPEARTINEEVPNSVIAVHNAYGQIVIKGKKETTTVSSTATSVTIRGDAAKRAIFVEAGAKVVFENVIIDGLGAALEGPGIYIADRAKVVLKDGVVVQGSSSGTGAAIYPEEGETLTLSEGARVNGSVFLHDSDTIIVAGKLSDTARASITIDTVQKPFVEKRRVLCGTTDSGNNTLFLVASPRPPESGRVYFIDERGWVDPNATIDDISVIVSPGSLVLRHPGDTETLTAEVFPVGTDQAVIWSSSDDAVATVASNGTVTAVGPGVATITARSAVDSSKTSSGTVEVMEPVGN
jgi:hypothetical protein